MTLIKILKLDIILLIYTLTLAHTHTYVISEMARNYTLGKKTINDNIYTNKYVQTRHDIK